MSTGKNEVERFLAVDEAIRKVLPHFHAWSGDEESFRRFQIKARDDGTFLAVASGYGADGTPMVCFGQGYGVIGALYGLDRAIQGDNWRVDKYAGVGKGIG